MSMFSNGMSRRQQVMAQVPGVTTSTWEHNGVLCSWLQHGPSLPTVDLCGTIQQTESLPCAHSLIVLLLSLSLSPSFHPSLCHSISLPSFFFLFVSFKQKGKQIYELSTTMCSRCQQSLTLSKERWSKNISLMLQIDFSKSILKLPPCPLIVEANENLRCIPVLSDWN